MIKKEELCEEDRIDYKILNHGINSITDSELISAIIGEQVPFVSRNLLNSVSNNLLELGKNSYYDIRTKGVTHEKAIRIMASIELGRRRKLTEPLFIRHIRQSKDVAEIFWPMLSDLTHEEFWLLFINRSNKVINKMKLSQGGLSGTVTDIRIIMKKALEYAASGIIACHNHPSGNLNPSESDTKITKKIKDAGDLMDIALLDHIIIADKNYYSFADNGLI